MKTFIHKIFLLCFFSFVIVACKKEEDRVVLQEGTAPALTASVTTAQLLHEQADEEAVAFTWTESDFGFPAAVNYTLQLARAGTDFAEARNIDAETRLQQGFSVAELNRHATQLGLEPDVEGQIEARVRATLAEAVDPVYSNVLTLDVTPYTTEVVEVPGIETIYMVGDATQNAWDNANPTPMFISTEDENTFTYTGYLEAGMLKFLAQPGQWAPQWGDDESGNLQPRPTEDDPDPAPFDVPADGFYTVTVDTLALTYSLEEFDETAATNYESIGIIGIFNDWGGIEAMERSAFNPHIWSIEHTFEEDTEMKFRIAEGWEVNWGPGDNPDRLYGRGVQDGANIELPAGTYRIIFNDISGHYLFLSR